ncbi:hypothetical protein QR680_018183 [Steinernema hermaphroditum]|uniref:F-box domain-containing protein n=1 Tax=Steinernema hermaphroditum TaxID=289476 RepID=A0AA39HH51_9BILA|nr:hypothetical protein QR680_018183 [Steinernema hermaphroditum]
MISLLPFWRRKSKSEDEPLALVDSCTAREKIRANLLALEFEWFNRNVDIRFEDHSRDVLLLIFDQLSLNGKLVCRAVCRRFRDVLDSVLKISFSLHLRTYNRGETVHFHLQRNESDSIIDSSEFWPGLPNRTLLNLNPTFAVTSLYLAKQSCNLEVVKLMNARVGRHLREVRWHNASCNARMTVSFLNMLSTEKALKYLYFQEDDLRIVESIMDLLERDSLAEVGYSSNEKCSRASF